MSEIRNCFVTEQTYNFELAALEVEQAVLEAGCLIEGSFTLASGTPAKRKLDLEKLADYPEQFEIVAGYLSTHPCLRQADVLLAVPEGAQNLFGERLSRDLEITWVRLRRVEGGTRYDFAFETEQDREAALFSKRPRIVEDVVTTLGSVAGVAKLLEPERQDIHSIAVWRRGQVNPNHQRGITDHYLVERYISLE